MMIERQRAMNAFIIPPPGGDERDYPTNPIYQNSFALTLRWLTNCTSYNLRYNQDLPSGGSVGYAFHCKNINFGSSTSKSDARHDELRLESQLGNF
jgi:hypothetical protein